jgi:short-subunit dehydrogenase
MKRQLQERRILITGASSGIGYSLAELAGAAGVRLALAARSADRLHELADKLSARGVDVLSVPTDITLEEDRKHLLDQVTQRFGGLDVLINNAGIGSFAHFADSDEGILRQVMEVNFFAPVELIRLAIPILALGQQPAVVNVASMCGRRGMPAWPEYSASKFALTGMSEALRGELVRFGIDVLLILPGLTRTDLPKHLLKSQGRFKIDFEAGMPPEQAAAGILKALQNNRAETVLGREARWMLRFHRFFPRLLDWLITRRIKKMYPREQESEVSSQEPASKALTHDP